MGPRPCVNLGSALKHYVNPEKVVTIIIVKFDFNVYAARVVFVVPFGKTVQAESRFCDS